MTCGTLANPSIHPIRRIVTAKSDYVHQTLSICVLVVRVREHSPILFRMVDNVGDHCNCNTPMLVFQSQHLISPTHNHDEVASHRRLGEDNGNLCFFRGVRFFTIILDVFLKLKRELDSSQLPWNLPLRGKGDSEPVVKLFKLAPRVENDPQE